MSSPLTSTLYANQQHLLYEPSFQLLSSSTTSTPHPVHVCHAPIEVDHFSNCPNIYCTIPVQHTYYYDVVKPCPQDMPTVLLCCFHPNLNLFPNDMWYEVMEVPSFSLEHGCQAYIMGYGVVCLLEMAVNITKRSKDWKVFQCIQGGRQGWGEVIITELVVRNEWCKISKRHLGFCGVSSISSDPFFL